MYGFSNVEMGFEVVRVDENCYRGVSVIRGLRKEFETFSILSEKYG